MRVIKYPEPEKEEFITCSICKAELAYQGSDCRWKDGVAGDIKYIKCPCCGHEIRVAYIPYPIYAGKKVFEFSNGSWVKEANP